MPKPPARHNPKSVKSADSQRQKAFQASKVRDLLDKSGLTGRAIGEFVARQQSWEAFFAARLPASLAREISHVVEKDGVLTVCVSSAAWSARLKFALAECWPAVVAQRPTLQRWVVKIQPVAASTGART
jgi:predicted nucleic acid-binding Zn ribbon protein